MAWTEWGQLGWRESHACEEHFQQKVELTECGTDWRKAEEETAVRDDSLAEATGLSGEWEGTGWHLLSINVCVPLDVCGPTYVSGKVALPWARLCSLCLPPMVSQMHVEARIGAWSIWYEAGPVHCTQAGGRLGEEGRSRWLTSH